MTTMTLQAAGHAAFPCAAEPPTHSPVWRSSSLVDLYLARLREALPMHHPQIEIMIRLIATARTPVARFLDLGCGDGILGAALLERFPLAHGVFADASDDVLQIARTKLQPYSPQLAFLTLDLGGETWQNTVAPYGPFDVVVSGYAIHHLPDRDKRRVYRAIHALLRPGGRFINIEYVAAPSVAGEDMFMAYLIDHAYAAAPQYGSMMTQTQVTGAVEDLMHRPDDRPALVEEQCAWLRALGFADVDCYFKLFGFAVFGGRRAGGPSVVPSSQ
jgi:tRNA (cmo5U34)-methyltransferase